ncbi:MAG TPA: long-chain fatty acid--CoA ligase [Bryobacteraceae bacterium]|nr:long-chain fatty acid--CoA ligase [Bryobacteraceae bacterium]
MQARTLYAVLEDTASKLGDKPALYQPKGGREGDYQVTTWAEYRDAAREIACGLRSLGFGRGDIIGLASETRAEFYLADMGVMTNGSIAAAVYTSLPAREQAATIAQSDAKAVFIENAKALKALKAAGAPDVPWFVLVGEAEGAMTLAQLRARGRAALEQDPRYFERIKAEVKPEDQAILYMTSGATGAPKMGLVTHHSVVSNLDLGPRVVDIGPEDVTLAFLPSAHIAQRVAVQLLPMRVGMTVYFSESLSKMPIEMRRVRPTFLLAPPRVWERIYTNITAEIRKKPGVTRRIFYTALGLGLRLSQLRSEGKPIPGWMASLQGVADRLVFSKIRERLGGRLQTAISGSAPLGKELAQFFQAVNVPLIEGYGLTEGGITTLNPMNRPKPGTIGVMFPTVEAKISEEGELLLKGPTIFSGYYKDPEATASVLRDGWLHTGDIAEIDSEGYISITGRKKELIVASNGKKIYPSRIEQLFKMEPLINQVVLIGDRQPYVTALFTINPTLAEALPGMEEFKGRSLPEIASAPQVLETVQRAVKDANRQLAPFEQIRRFRILEREFSIEQGELTPTMKVRRKQVLENYRSIVNELYLGREEMV